MVKELAAEFEKVFGAGEGPRVFFAPGRVNLIGEHTDYNGGHVFPCALSLGTYGAVRKRKDSQIRLYSLNFPDTGIVEGDVESLEPGDDSTWASYVKGVVWAFLEKGMVPGSGFDMAVSGDIPAGAGLSSSASLEVMTGEMLRSIYGFDVSNVEIALLGQYAENRYCGLSCGIMDQFASAMGKKDNAVFLDTNTLEYEYVPLPMDGKKIIVTNTNKKHSLVDSAYNDRRRECEEALGDIRRVKEIDALCQLTPEEYEKVCGNIEDPLARKRALHAVTENQRTVDAVKVLKGGDLESFGRLMNESHVSLRDDYEVSCEELDVLAETAWKVPGVLGARMTGGGFGGCTVSLVDDDAVEQFRETLGDVYRNRFGYDCSFYVVSAGEGPREIGGTE